MFKCESPVNKEVINECAKPVLRRTKFYLVLLGIAGSIALLGTYLAYMNFYDRFSLAVLCIVSWVIVIAIACFTYFMSVRRFKKVQLQRLQTVLQKDSLTLPVEIDDESVKVIKADEPESKPMLKLKDVSRIDVTENFIVLMFKGHIFTALDIRTIEGGTKEELIVHLKKCCK